VNPPQCKQTPGGQKLRQLRTPQGTGSDWKNLPGTAQFLSTQTNRRTDTMFAFIYKIVMFHKRWQSTQIQLKSCCWVEKLSSIMDCSRLCTAAAGHLDIVVSGSAASDWQFCALQQDNSSTSSDDASMYPRSPVFYTVFCTNQSRPARGQREWNLPLTFFIGCTTTLGRRQTHLSSSLFLIPHPLWGQNPTLAGWGSWFLLSILSSRWTGNYPLQQCVKFG
jgi:hypothetical protein